jgi:hypothetical protein
MPRKLLGGYEPMTHSKSLIDVHKNKTNTVVYMSYLSFSICVCDRNSPQGTKKQERKLYIALQVVRDLCGIFLVIRFLVGARIVCVLAMQVL